MSATNPVSFSSYCIPPESQLSSWNFIGSQYTAKENTIKDCGLVFRGDSRPSDEIFEHGFTIRELSQTDTFHLKLKELFQTSQITQLHCEALPTTAVCASMSVAAASFFPKWDESTNVYAFRAARAVPLHETIKEIEGPNSPNKLMYIKSHEISGLSVASDVVPSRDVIGYWKVSKQNVTNTYVQSYDASFSTFHQHAPTISSKELLSISEISEKSVTVSFDKAENVIAWLWL
ncbi:hypothetical protein D5018_14500 [Parashewanella curva]|uniref:Uncharacterized protein n=1 Tax=Parashewanella curva TaxID=2338552 RepID=A0A3L8PUA0_9GAMM|nr:hypothetical protein [Parashewanella curva]RLV58981.1 hypothetical protein D5018_14500 [Parashewanella curva]